MDMLIIKFLNTSYSFHFNRVKIKARSIVKSLLYQTYRHDTNDALASQKFQWWEGQNLRCNHGTFSNRNQNNYIFLNRHKDSVFSF